MPLNLTPKQIARFWSRVNKGGPVPAHRPDLGRCWLWLPEPNRKYGRMNLWKQEHLAHRVSYEIANGPIPDELLVCHHCDTPRCVNPSHFFLGTYADNNHDMMKKGRFINGMTGNVAAAARGDRHVSRTKPDRVPRGDRSGRRTKPERTARGERSWNSRLTEETVKEIRARYQAGGVSQHQLAAMYGVDRSTIQHVVSGNSWKHVS